MASRYDCAPVQFSELMLKIHQYSMMCAPTMSQFAALEALRAGNDEVIRMRDSYKKRRNFMTTSFNEMGLTCHVPGGAFYVFLLYLQQDYLQRNLQNSYCWKKKWLLSLVAYLAKVVKVLFVVLMQHRLNNLWKQ